jgi:probable HAF family extracellular repeat protein
LLWHGSAESVVDLTPPGANGAQGTAISRAGQVGYGGVGEFPHALLWQGTAESFVDLHPFLSAVDPAFLYSYATGISENGSIVGYATTDNIDRRYAVLWTPVPEPSSCAILSLLARRQRPSATGLSDASRSAQWPCPRIHHPASSRCLPRIFFERAQFSIVFIRTLCYNDARNDRSGAAAVALAAVRLKD